MSVASWPIRHLLIGNWLRSRYLFCPLLGNGPPGSRQFPVDWLVAYGENIGNEYLELVALEQRVGVVAAGPGQLGTEAPFAAEGQGFLEVDRRLVKFAHGVGQEG